MSNCIAQACSAALLAFTLMLSSASHGGAEGLKPAVSASGVIATKSAYTVEETVVRLKKDIAAKGIVFFQEIDQAALATKAGIELRPSVLLIFGNPPLGTQFITANPQAGLDWPVRMLVRETADGKTEIAYTDFAFIGKRYGIKDKDAQLKMASEVAATVAGEAAQ